METKSFFFQLKSDSLDRFEQVERSKMFTKERQQRRQEGSDLKIILKTTLQQYKYIVTYMVSCFPTALFNEKHINLIMYGLKGNTYFGQFCFFS